LFLHQLRANFQKSVPVSESFFRLMKANFGFYVGVCQEFHSKLGTQLEQNQLHRFLQEDLLPRLFAGEVCERIEPIKKAFLGEIIKLEQFLAQVGPVKVNDLDELKSIADSIYELLQTHWEFYRYQKSVVNDRVLVGFVQEIERIAICWDTYVAKYLAATGILGVTERVPDKVGMSAVKVYYHLPVEAGLPLEMATRLGELFQVCYEFVLEVHGQSKESQHPLEVLNFEMDHPVLFTLALPDALADSFARLIDYLSIDVIKRETLVKYVMEVVRQQQGQDLAKPVMNNYIKKISKAFEGLHPEGFLGVDAEEERDSVAILSRLLRDLERMKHEYGDLMNGAEERLARNRLENPNPVAQVPPLASSPVNPDPASTVKISVAKKEHHGFLTS